MQNSLSNKPSPEKIICEEIVHKNVLSIKCYAIQDQNTETMKVLFHELGIARSQQKQERNYTLKLRKGKKQIKKGKGCFVKD